MTFVSVLLALIAEQFRALGRNNPIYDIVRVLSGRAEHAFDTGRTRDARLAWLTVVVPLTLAVMVVHYLLASISVALTLAWNVLLLYLTLGFRQFSHYFTDIHEALNRDDLPAARALLHEWTGLDTMEMPVTEIVRHTLEAAIVAAHRHVFGVFFWFLVPIGPGGVVLYRTAEYLGRHWNEPSTERSPALGRFAARAFYVLDWLPSRLTSIGFAIVGNFEDAVYAWRNHARKFNDSVNGILLASGGGALGVRLGTPLAEDDSAVVLRAIPAGPALDYAPEPDDDGGPEPAPPEFGTEPVVRTLQSAVGLVWRAVVLWMLLLAMLSLALWVG
ncbi:cobalamin biosynthesis protein CobD [Cupriavidus sp. USMAA2-4]|uniref:Cobalamin biosynthesis protein CobD n=1 Tax=Cupriavidus malaysiensis TaxID=367825 RepID=A0ABM6F6K8_9BURK|nr:MULTISPECIES: CobD/CbiB family protein [Cupriavidus]AOY93266.1 cobalamin biosynthesis protein CobD [Cupriavidus sp. USMAA2-4]AOZ00442.1 cobalamin biosynthesis protein CobD [Cupriavidus sp. USMAHM13]AOZ07188.1 cobalamin biosynthesis protein CobD [Cupriavidus malaysiensis]